jgi:hypothetical protein
MFFIQNTYEILMSVRKNAISARMLKCIFHSQNF